MLLNLLLLCHWNQRHWKLINLEVPLTDLGIRENWNEKTDLKVINARQSLLKAKFPDTLGLQDVVRAQTCSFAAEEEGEFVQIINSFDDHWVCVINKNCKQNEVKMYDSMCIGDLCLYRKEAVASLVRTSRKHFFLTFSDVQQQDGGCDFGLYAHAFSFFLCGNVCRDRSSKIGI